MLPGLGGLDPKKMQALMKQMGIKQEEIEASKVVIHKNSGDRIIIENPSVQKITMQGQISFQVSGNEKEETFSEKDIETIMEKTSCTKAEAKKALEETSDIAEAIIKLSE